MDATAQTVSCLLCILCSKPKKLLTAVEMHIAMNVLFNNQLLYVIDYPGFDALEILDKRNGRMGLLRGATAYRIRGEFSQFLAEDHDQDEFEDFMDIYEAVLNQPVSLH